MELLIALNNSISAANTTPKEFQILPLGRVHSQKGDFLVDNESFASIRKDFKERQLQIPVDYEHQTLKDVEAPAAGWITDLALKSDGVYAIVNWTDRATEYLRNREYKYCSPVISVRASDRKALKLHSVALTNKPAIDAMIPIVTKNGSASAHTDNEDVVAEGEAQQTNELAKLAQLLGLPSTATLEDIYKVIAALSTEYKELKLKCDTIEFEAFKAKAVNIVESGLREGKILSYQRDWAFRSAMNDVEEFSLWLKSAPQVIPIGEFAPDDFEKPMSRSSHSDRLMGLSESDIKNYR